MINTNEHIDSDAVTAEFNVLLDAATKSPIATGVSSMLETLTKLALDSQTWETTQLKTANEALYRLLQRCYTIYKDATANKTDAALLQIAINDYYNLHNLKLDKNAHTLNNIVKLVFGVDRKRASAYAIALRVALAEKVEPQDLPTFLSDAGGCEEVRRKGKKPGTALTAKQKSDTAKTWLAANDFGSYRNDALTAELDAAKISSQHLLIATQQADGSLQINGLISTAGIVETALAAYYAKHKEEHAKRDVEQTQRNSNSSLDAAIDTAANSIAR